MSTDNDKNVMRWCPTEEWRPWQRKSKELTSWTQLTAWPAHLNVIQMSQTWKPTISVLGFLHKPEEKSEVWSSRNCSKSCADECLSLIQVTKSYLAKMDLLEVKLLSFWMNIRVSCTLAKCWGFENSWIVFWWTCMSASPTIWRGEGERKEIPKASCPTYKQGCTIAICEDQMSSQMGGN